MLVVVVVEVVVVEVVVVEVVVVVGIVVTVPLVSVAVHVPDSQQPLDHVPDIMLLPVTVPTNVAT